MYLINVISSFKNRNLDVRQAKHLSTSSSISRLHPPGLVENKRNTKNMNPIKIHLGNLLKTMSKNFGSLNIPSDCLYINTSGESHFEFKNTPIQLHS
jgi:hypothetical protein